MSLTIIRKKPPEWVNLGRTRAVRAALSYKHKWYIHHVRRENHHIHIHHDIYSSLYVCLFMLIRVFIYYVFVYVKCICYMLFIFIWIHRMQLLLYVRASLCVPMCVCALCVWERARVNTDKYAYYTHAAYNTWKTINHYTNIVYKNVYIYIYMINEYTWIYINICIYIYVFVVLPIFLSPLNSLPLFLSLAYTIYTYTNICTTASNTKICIYIYIYIYI